MFDFQLSLEKPYEETFGYALNDSAMVADVSFAIVGPNNF